MAVVRPTDEPAYIAGRVIGFILWIIEVILAARVILRLIGANSAAGFTRFVYNISAPLVNPFLNIVRNSPVNGVRGGVVEWFTLIAMVVYWLLGWAIMRLLTITYSRPVEPV